MMQHSDKKFTNQHKRETIHCLLQYAYYSDD